MNCCQGIEEIFSPEYVAGELKHYRTRGPAKTTRILIQQIKTQDIRGRQALDIGGGLGAIQHELLAAGAAQAIHVDASSAYLTASKQEGARRGFDSRIRYIHGNFVELSETIPTADIVTLDRVICCYSDMRRLVGTAAQHAGQLLGLVYPRNTWWIRFGLAAQNGFLSLRRSPFRTYMHPTQAVEQIIENAGLKRLFYRRTFFWQVVLFGR